MTEEAKHELREHYIEIRTQNEDDGGVEEKPVPTTPRSLDTAWRVSAAFARLHLSETIEIEHVNRAVRLVKHRMGYNLDPETGDFDGNRTSSGETFSQKKRTKKLKDAIAELDTHDNGAKIDEVIASLTTGTELTEKKVRDEMESLMRKGEAYEQVDGFIRLT